MALKFIERSPRLRLVEPPQTVKQPEIIPFPEKNSEEDEKKEEQSSEKSFYGSAFELGSAFQKFLLIAHKKEIPEAMTKVLPLIEMNMQSYVQEESRQKNMPQFATKVHFQTLKSGRRFPVFQNTQYLDVRATEIWKIKEKISSDAHKRFFAELGQYYRVWLKIVRQIPEKTDEKSLLQAGFYLTENFPIQTSLKGLTEISKKFTRAFVAPQKLLYASPSSQFHLDGLSTILRHAQLVYLPEIKDFFIVDEGYFSGHSNEEVVQYLQSDREQKMLPKSDNEFFHFQAVLSTEDSKLIPAKLFAELRKRYRIPSPKPLPLGQNVADESFKRKYKTQLKFISELFSLEFSRFKNGESENSILERLAIAAQLVQHSLGRAKDFDDVSALVQIYAQELKSFPKLIENQANPLDTKVFFSRVALVHKDILAQLISKIDCAGTTVLGGRQAITEMLFGNAGKGKLINKISSVINNKTQLLDGCKRLGIDSDLFSLNKEKRQCPSCKKVRQFMGPCICPECHFDLVKNGLTETSAEIEKSQELVKKPQVTQVFPPKTTLNNFVSSFFVSASAA